MAGEIMRREKTKQERDRELLAFRREELAPRRAQVRREAEDLAKAEAIEAIEDSPEYKVGYWIGVLVVIGLSPLILIVVLFLAFAGGAPLFVLDFMANKDQWKSRRSRY